MTTRPRPLAVALAGLLVVASVLVSPNFRSNDGGERPPFAGDFLHEYVGGWIVRAGDRARLYDEPYYTAIEHDAEVVGFRLLSDRFFPMVYPPIYYRVVSPLSRLPYRAAAWVWLALSLASFGVVVALLGRELSSSGALDRAEWPRMRRLAGLIALPTAVAFVPFAENLASSQKGTFLLLALTGALSALRHERRLVAGLVLGIVAVKPQLALVVPIALVAKGERRVALGVAVAGGILVAGSIAMGPKLALAYARVVSTFGGYVESGAGYRDRMHGLYAFWTVLLGGPTWLVLVLTGGSAAGVVACLTRLLRGPLAVHGPRFLVQFSGLVLATVLLAPHVLTYDLTILLLPMCLLGWLALHGALPPRVLWLVVALYATTAISAPIARSTGLQVTTPVLVALLAVLAGLPGQWIKT